MTSLHSLQGTLVTITVILVLSVTGCAGQQPDYGQKAADRFQGEVLEVSQLSAAADFTAAMVSLSELEVDLKDARARGEITEARFESVMAAVELVRLDLQAAIEAQSPSPTPTPTPEDDDDDDDGKKGKDKGKGKNKGNGDD